MPSPKHPLLLIFGQKHGFSSLGVVGSNPPDFKVWTVKIWKTKVWAEISVQCQVRNTPYFWFSAKNKDFQFLEVVGSNPPWQVGLKMQKLSNLASQQWSTPPRIILTKFHQNRPKIAPVTEKSTLLTDLALAPDSNPHWQFDSQLSQVITKNYSTTPRVPMGIWGLVCDPRTKI